MIHRSSSSRRKKTQPSAPSPQRSASLVRRQDLTKGDDKFQEKEEKKDKRLSIGENEPSTYRRVSSGVNTTNTITVTGSDERNAPTFAYTSERAEEMESNINLNEYPHYKMSRNSATPDEFYSTRRQTDSSSRMSRTSLTPEGSKTPRTSLVPDDAYNRSPRGSIDPTMFNRGSRNSLLPDPDLYNRSSRPSMVADVTALRNSRNSLIPDLSPNRSPRNSLVPDTGRSMLPEGINRSPRGSLVPDSNRSPRSSLVPDSNRTPRGSFAVETVNRTPRGSIASEGSYNYNRNSRSSLPLQDMSGTLGKSPRGSVASATGVQFDLSNKTPRGSIESVPPGIKPGQRSTSPYQSGSIRGHSGTADNAEGSRRASSNVSQVGVSSDDRRHLCEHTKLTQDANMGLTAYGSFVYQLNHANMESANTLDFVLRAMDIIYRTAAVTVLLVCLLTLPLVMLIMGLEFIKDCPKAPSIPTYMIIGGCFGFIKLLWILWRQIRSLRYRRLNTRDEPRTTDSEEMLALSTGTKIGCHLLSMFLIFWFLLGNYWILRIYKPEFEPTLFEPDNFCDKTLYVFSIVHLVIIYSILIIILLVVIIMGTIQVCLLRCR